MLFQISDDTWINPDKIIYVRSYVKVNPSSDGVTSARMSKHYYVYCDAGPGADDAGCYDLSPEEFAELLRYMGKAACPMTDGDPG